MCTAMIALVRGVIFASTSAGSRLSVVSISPRTGVARLKTIDEMLAMKVNPGTMTSSPGPTPRAPRQSHSDAVPELVANAYRTPVHSATRSSSWRTYALKCGSSSGP